ncbi:MAG TPA: hypothetical protein PLP59_09910 [Thermotogota bacterium]|nr:hypothetical protein [Thermotogota bacterium]HQN22511.1 hypothetical protein [Thermotogota bacterium]
MMLHDEILTAIYKKLQPTGIATYKHYHTATGERFVLLLKGNFLETLQTAQLWIMMYTPNYNGITPNIARLGALKAIIAGALSDTEYTTSGAPIYLELYNIEGIVTDQANTNESFQIMRYKITTKE